MQYRIHSEEVVHDGFFKIREAKLTYDRFDNKTPFPVSRSVLDKGPASAVILHLRDTDRYVFVEQFRYPMTLIEGQSAWIPEIVAGVIDSGHTAEETAIKELREESGYVPDHVELIQEIYPSPGIMSEKISLFFASGLSKSTVPSGDPHDEEEDVRVVLFSVSELRSMLKNGQFRDAKTVIAIQHVLLNRSEN